ncbi:MAG: replicative DNA helicase, partial [Alistipes sp.]
MSDPDGVVDWATSEITAIADRVSRPDDITPLSEVVRATIDDLERRQQARQAGECIGIPTGLQRLDALTGGWRGGQLVVLAGRPGMGKSATMLHFARAAAASGVPVCVYSLEMPAGQLAGRMLVGSSGVDSGAFRTGNVDGAGWTKIEKAGATLSGMPVYLND